MTRQKDTRNNWMTFQFVTAGRKDKEDAENYIRNQLKHHNVTIIDDRQQRLNSFTAD